jgi:uncharacterized membrane protein YcaP (DUF421 family)
MEVVVRASVIFFFLWLVTRTIGKRELSEMTPFEIILLVVVGDLIQQGVTQEDTSLVGAMLAVSTVAFWILVFSWLDFRSTRAKAVIDGLPVVVVRDGQLLEEVLRCERVPLDELLAEARGQGIANLRDVQLAVLEPDGNFSFITRSGEQQRQDQKHEL